MDKKYYCKNADDVIACRKKYFPEDVIIGLMIIIL